MKNIIKYLLLITMCSMFLCACSSRHSETMVSITDASARTVSEEPNKDSQAAIYVYICGAVKNPGVYELTENSRIYELVDEAGGMTKKASADAVNLAESLTDGQMVKIPEAEETVSVSGTKTDAQTDTQDNSSSGGLVNLNTATAEELMTLSGIGESKAENIISYRSSNGSFTKIEDLMNVSGIGEGIYAKVKDSITV